VTTAEVGTPDVGNEIGSGVESVCHYRSAKGLAGEVTIASIDYLASVESDCLALAIGFDVGFEFLCFLLTE
jgi:hypothetical protein